MKDEPVEKQKVNGKRIALAAFFLWEAGWLYEFITAPRPDYEMQTVFAMLMGIVLPALLALPIAAALLGRRLGRHKPLGKPE